MNSIIEKTRQEQEVSDDALRIVFVGHVDHGKSTLVGRLLFETQSVLPSKIKYVEEICKDRGMQFEYAFLLDALEEEQDQGITIDVSQVLFKTKRRTYRVIDAPGHKEFLKNMISGASTADVAILLIDAEEGLREQSKRHATILSLLGVKTVLVIINKMDLVDYKKEVYDKIKHDYTHYLKSLKLTAKAFVPLSAYQGENVAVKSVKMPWYEGIPFLPLLDTLEHHRTPEEKPLRLPLQDVYKFDKQRIFAGRIESGKISEGDEIIFLPSEKTGVVKSVERWNVQRRKSATAGESIGLVLEDQIFAERGEVVCHASSKPQVSSSFLANIFWMGSRHLEKGAKCVLKLTTQEVECFIESVLKIINSSTLEEISKTAQEIAKNEVAEVIIRAKKPVVFDTFDEIGETGRFVLVFDKKVCGGGIILKKVEHFGHAI
jgi:sulfate adenylyltransferase large subunit